MLMDYGAKVKERIREENPQIAKHWDDQEQENNPRKPEKP